jgi:D-alanine-D-alanine ligase
MKKLRVMMLVHYTLVPPEDLKAKDDPRLEKYRTEFDVKTALLGLGHDVQVVGVYDDLGPIRATVEQWKPHIAFNLLEDFAGISAFDYSVVSVLELMRVPYTGCSPRGLILARDKALSKKLLTFDRIKVPNGDVFPFGAKPKKVRDLKFPLIVKSLMEEGSVGIARTSVVESEEELHDRLAVLHEKTQGDAIAEEYIEGRELYVTVLGNQKLEILPIRELVFGEVPAGEPKVATYRVKWNEDYRKRWGIEYQFARTLPNGMADEIAGLCKQVYRALDMSGYGRIDLRLAPSNEIYVLEANPNPGIARDEDCALSAIKAGMSYEEFIQRLLNLGLSRRSPTDES